MLCLLYCVSVRPAQAKDVFAGIICTSQGCVGRLKCID